MYRLCVLFPTLARLVRRRLSSVISSVMATPLTGVSTLPTLGLTSEEYNANGPLCQVWLLPPLVIWCRIHGVYEVSWTDLANQQLNELEADPTQKALVKAIEDKVDAIAANPANRRLRTKHFTTPEYSMVRHTPVGHDEWHILWVVRDDLIVVALIDKPVVSR
jgi:hypothetical protein